MSQRSPTITIIGHCTWRAHDYAPPCPCNRGYYFHHPGIARPDGECRNCGHLVSRHEDFQTLPTSMIPQSLVTEPIATPPPTIPRTELVDGIISRVERFHIIRINGPSASGKTTLMNLTVNSLLKKYGKTMPIHTITGWNEENVKRAGHWARYLQLVTGVHGHDWRMYPAFLLIDEAQQSYWDDALWSAFFKSIAGFPGIPYIILFTSCCLPGTSSPHIYPSPYSVVPMSFGPEAQIYLSPGADQDLWPWGPVGLQIRKDEAKHLVSEYAAEIISSFVSPFISPSVSLTDDFQESLFRCSSGHIGVLRSLTEALLRNKDIQAAIKHGMPVDRQTFVDSLSGNPIEFFESLSRECFTKGLPQPKDLENAATTHILEIAINSGAVDTGQFEGPETSKDLRVAAEAVWSNGWLRVDSEILSGCPVIDGRPLVLTFPTEIHRLYCQFLLLQKTPDNEKFVFSSSQRLNLSRLCHLPSSQVSNQSIGLAGSQNWAIGWTNNGQFISLEHRPDH